MAIMWDTQFLLNGFPERHCGHGQMDSLSLSLQANQKFATYTSLQDFSRDDQTVLFVLSSVGFAESESNEGEIMSLLHVFTMHVARDAGLQADVAVCLRGPQMVSHHVQSRAGDTALSTPAACQIKGQCTELPCVLLQDGTQKSQRVFVNLPTEVGATEAEEIGKASDESPFNSRLIA